MTSSEPSRRYSAGLRRLGFDERATVFYDEHVEADAVHEQIASVDMCGSLVAEEPALLPTSSSAPPARWRWTALAAQHLLAPGSRSFGPADGTRWPPDAPRPSGLRSAAPRAGSARRGGPARGTRRAENPDRLCEPSQNGLMPDLPQRHSAIVSPARVDLAAVLVERAGSRRGRSAGRRGRA